MSKRERQRAARRRGRTQRQKEARRAEARANLVLDPATDPARAADLLYETYGDEPVEVALVAAIAASGGIERARAVADAALERARGPLALCLAADIAVLDGRDTDAEQHVIEALELAESPGLSLRLAALQAADGRLDEAIDVLQTELAVNPGLPDLQVAYGDLLEEAQQQGEAPEAIRRFRDRSALQRLQAEVGRFIGTAEERSEAFADGLQAWIDAGAVSEDELTEWTDRASQDPSSPEAGRLQLMGEWAWLMPLYRDDGSLLDAFAADPALPPEARRRAADWLGWALWGLWEVGRPEAAPGVLMTELVTGIKLYVEVPAALLAEMPRWSVLLGYVLPVDGVWRLGGGCEIAGPVEGRLLLHELIDHLLEHAREYGKLGKAVVTFARHVHEDCDDLWMPGGAELSGETIAGLQVAMRSGAPNLVAALRGMQGRAPLGGVTRWFVMNVADPQAALRALARRDEFELDDGELIWFEEPEDLGPDDEADDPHYVRATLSLDDDGDLVAELELDEEVEELADLLGAAGHPASPVELEVDEGPPEPPVVLPDLSGDELVSWLRSWPDRQLDVLDGHTPREAVKEHRAEAVVEMLIRYLEHDADVRGLRGLDTDDLRLQLGLDDPDTTEES